MSRKRSSKEKSAQEEQAVTDDGSHALVSAPAPMTWVSDFTLYSDRCRYLCGVAVPPSHTAVPHFGAAQLDWWRHIAATLPSPLLYPSHTLCLTMNHAIPLPSMYHDSVAAAILSTLDLHRCACAWPVAPTSDGRKGAVTADVADAVGQLIGHCVMASGYSGPEIEQHATTFTTSTAPGSARLGVTSSPSLTVMAHFRSTHVNVCCGLYYYKLDVLDCVHAVPRSRTELSRDLAAIHDDAVRREASALYHRNVAPEVAEDIRGMYALLARVSAVDDMDASDVYRRLEAEGEVNAYTLATLQSALFTVVLDGPSAPENRAEHAQWLHSGLSLYFNPNARGVFFLRAHGAITDANTARLVAEHIAGRVAKSLTPPFFIEPIKLRPAASSDMLVGCASPMNTTIATADALARRVGGGAEALEMWLPEKHRMALRPYVAVSCAPQWSTSDSLSNRGTAAEILLSLLIACEAVLYDEGTPHRPRVCLVTQNAASKVPQAIPLYSEATEAFIQYSRTSQTRSLRDTQQRLRADALSRLHEALTLADLVASSSTAENVATDMPEMDVCVTAQRLPWVQDASREPYHVRSCLSSLGVPARLFINCTVQQTQVQKVPRLGDGRAVALDVGCVSGEEAFAEAIHEAVESNLRVVCSP